MVGDVEICLKPDKCPQKFDWIPNIFFSSHSSEQQSKRTHKVPFEHPPNGVLNVDACRQIAFYGWNFFWKQTLSYCIILVYPFYVRRVYVYGSKAIWFHLFRFVPFTHCDCSAERKRQKQIEENFTQRPIAKTV